MPLKILMEYKPPIKEIKKEEDVKFLLEDLKDEISQFSSQHYSLPKILESVEKKGTITILFPKDPIFKVIDLSEAQLMLSGYRHLSEGGCTSCTHVKSYKPYSDETYAHCKINETEKDVNDRTGKSPSVEKYWNNSDCPNLKHIFQKTIEEIISQD